MGPDIMAFLFKPNRSSALSLFPTHLFCANNLPSSVKYLIATTSSSCHPSSLSLLISVRALLTRHISLISGFIVSSWILTLKFTCQTRRLQQLTRLVLHFQDGEPNPTGLGLYYSERHSPSSMRRVINRGQLRFVTPSPQG